MDGAGITVKLILIGDSAVGKSRWGRAGPGGARSSALCAAVLRAAVCPRSLLLRFAEGSFEPSLKPTICEPGGDGGAVWGRGL